jgi:cobyrinic acid a,c-diamide synthase
VLGGLPKRPDLMIPDRHLGLVTADDHTFTKGWPDLLAGFIEDHLEVDRLIDGLSEVGIENAGFSESAISIDGQQNPFDLPTLNGVKIGVARDNAFCFYYPENLELLEKYGARIVFFSPVNDRILPAELDGLYFGGGYPELHASALSQNSSMRNAVLSRCESGMPVYAECGGFMYLCDRLITKDGKLYDMVKSFPFTCRMKDRRAALGYREIRLAGSTPLGDKGLTARGHEFHYSFLENQESEKSVRKVYAATDRSGEDRGCPGYLVNRCLGSYVHLHFGSCPQMAHNFVSACCRYQTERKEKNNASF